MYFRTDLISTHSNSHPTPTLKPLHFHLKRDSFLLTKFKLQIAFRPPSVSQIYFESGKATFLKQQNEDFQIEEPYWEDWFLVNWHRF